MPEPLFDSSLVPAPLAEATGGEAWVRAMLDFEAALAAVQAEAGIVPAEAASAIEAAAVSIVLDPAQLGLEAAATGAPAEPLVRALRAAVGPEAGKWVHFGTTSQDVVDSAAMLVARRALVPIEADLSTLAGACAALAERHRETPMLARTLLQPALPSSFGLLAARWMVAIEEAGGRLGEVGERRLALQLGGPAGTLAAYGDAGPDLVTALAARLGLAEPRAPWHTSRGPVHALGGALDEAAGAAAKVALDVILLAQAEIGEVAEPAAPGRGGSSSLAHKRNPLGSVLALAGARRVHAAAALLTASMPQELERSASGAWHAEWAPLSESLALCGGVAATMVTVLGGLEVEPGRMRENLAASGVPGGAEPLDPAIPALVDRLLGGRSR